MKSLDYTFLSSFHEFQNDKMYFFYTILPVNTCFYLIRTPSTVLKFRKLFNN